MARYGGDYGRNPGWTGVGTGNYDRDFGGGGYYGGRGTYERGFDIGPTWGGGSDVGYRGYRTDRARGYGYDRDFGDRLQEGWNDLKRGARRAFGGGYDRSYYGGRGNYGNRGGYAGYGRGYDRGWF
jgi:hypothetical protein